MYILYVCSYHQTFRMLNVRPLHKRMRNCSDSTLGFPLLEELCIATTSYSYMTDKDLQDILFTSNKLRVLDLRGCSRITPAGLASLPCNGRKYETFVNVLFYCIIYIYIYIWESSFSVLKLAASLHFFQCLVKLFRGTAL